MILYDVHLFLFLTANFNEKDHWCNSKQFESTGISKELIKNNAFCHVPRGNSITNCRYSLMLCKSLLITLSPYQIWRFIRYRCEVQMHSIVIQITKLIFHILQIRIHSPPAHGSKFIYSWCRGIQNSVRKTGYLSRAISV